MTDDESDVDDRAQGPRPPRWRRVVAGVEAVLLLPVLVLVLWCWAHSLPAPPDEGEARRARVERQLDSVRASLRDPATAWRMAASFPEGATFVHSLYGFAWAALGRGDPGRRARAAAEVRWAAERMEDEIVLRPFHDTQVPRGVFWAGQRNLLLVDLMELTPPAERDPALERDLHEGSARLAEAFLAAPAAHLSSYRGGTWPADNVTALVSLVLHDRLYGTRHGAAWERWKAWTLAHPDPLTGLPPGRVDEATGAVLEPARGCATSWILPLVARVDPDVAQTWYARYRERFGVERLGFRMFREWPPEDSRAADVDSGPIILGAGVTATGVGLAAARAVGDARTAADVDVLAETLGFPWERDGRRSYLGGELPVADLFLAYGRSLPLGGGAPSRPSAPSWSAGLVARWPFHVLCAVLTASLIALLVRLARALR